MDEKLREKIVVSPSILSADFAYLGDAISNVTQVTDRIHVDVMDGHFVSNLTIGPPVVKSLRKHTQAYLDCHLMVTNPEVLIDAFVTAGASAITVHVELDHVSELLEQIRESGVDVGISFNPDTPFSKIQPFMDRIDILLFMSVFPGYGGQSFIPEVLNKVVEAVDYRKEHNLDVVFTIDGGINKETAMKAALAGSDVLVAGNAVFGQVDPKAAVVELEEIANNALAGEK